MSLISSFIRFLTRADQKTTPVAEAPPLLIDRAALESILDMEIRNPALFEQALRHRSVLRHEQIRSVESNERLEFLGDAVLGLIIGEHLYHRYAQKDEGFLTRTRAKLVNGKILAEYARIIGLPPHVLISRNMEDTNGRDNGTILSDAFEAIIGAIYLDQGYRAAQTFVLRVLVESPGFDDAVSGQANHKSDLLEFAQARGWAQPEYRLIEESGPSHQRTFTVAVWVRNEALGEGTGSSKKQAEQRAAAQAMSLLREKQTVSAE